MAFEEITKHTIKGAAIRELQGYGKTVLAGAAAATNIALTGATVRGTTLASVLAYDPAGGGAGVGQFADLTDEASVTSDGNIQLDTTDTTGQQLIVEFFNKA